LFLKPPKYGHYNCSFALDIGVIKIPQAWRTKDVKADIGPGATRFIRLLDGGPLRARHTRL
jgi:hypothetical protein